MEFSAGPLLRFKLNCCFETGVCSGMPTKIKGKNDIQSKHSPVCCVFSGWMVSRGDIKDSTLKEDGCTFGEEKSNNHLLLIHEIYMKWEKWDDSPHQRARFFEPSTGLSTGKTFPHQRMGVLIIVLRLVQGGLFYQLQLGL